MALFGKRGNANADRIQVVLTDEADGYTYLVVNGVTYGKSKTGGEIIVNSDLSTIRRSEALIGLTPVSMGVKDTTKIAELILGFRKHQQSRKG
jgi:hypothetical protein